MTDHHDHAPRWRDDGVRVITGDRLDANTPQTPGMFRQAVINHTRVGAQKIWAGTVTIETDVKTGVHHRGALESVIFVLCGKARMRWGERLEYVAEAEPGDFIFVPSYVWPKLYDDLHIKRKHHGRKRTQSHAGTDQGALS